MTHQQSPQTFAPGQPPGGPAFVTPPPSPVRHWAWQLLYWAPIPLVTLLVVPIVLLGLRGRAVRQGGIDEANSRAALNWTVTWLVAVVATIALHVVMLLALSGGGAVAIDAPQGVVLTVTAILFCIAFFGGGIVTLINLIRGWGAASRGEVAGPWLAIPFFRPAREASQSRVA